MDEETASKISNESFHLLSLEEKRALIDKALFPWQREAFWLQEEIYKNEGMVCNLADGGAGKTLMTGLLARLLNKDIVLFTMPTPFIAWDEDMPRIGVNIKFKMSYPILKGKTVCSHNLLIRTENDEYIATEELDEIFKDKPIVVYDEVHYARNKDALLNKALRRVSQRARQNGCSIIAISATPSPAVADAGSYVHLFALSGDGEMLGLDKSTGKYVPLAAAPFFSYCKKINPTVASTILKRTLNPNTINEILFKLVSEVFFRKIGIWLKPDTPPRHHITVRYDLPAESMKFVQEASTTRARAIGAAMNKGCSSEKRYDADNKYDQRTEPILVRDGVIPHIKKLALENPNKKFVLFYKYHETHSIAKQLLEEDYPGKVAIMDGSTPPEQRRIISTIYKEDSDEIRFLITSKDVGGVSLSLDDRIGNRPRDVFKREDRIVDRSIQSDWRTSRATSKSPTTIYNCYIKGVRAEEERYKSNNLKKKTVNKYKGIGEVQTIKHS